MRAAQRSKILDGHRSGRYARQRTAACPKGRPFIMRGKPASWLSMLSILCHFHGLLFARQGLARTSVRRHLDVVEVELHLVHKVVII